jgi:hypothetical protein
VTALYLDASAIAKLVIEEPETAELRERVLGHALFTSRIASVEVPRAVRRANPLADPGPILRLFGFLELDAELSSVAATIGPSQVQALDAIHLASAARLGDELGAFITYDDRQAAAAIADGMTVESPRPAP